MNDLNACMAEMDRLAQIQTDIPYDTGEVICAFALPCRFL